MGEFRKRNNEEGVDKELNGELQAREYKKFGLPDLSGLVCTKCHTEILPGERVISINFGMESKKSPMKDYLRFTGMAYHEGRCLGLSDLPGMEGRDKEFSRANYPCPGSKMTH